MIQKSDKNNMKPSLKIEEKSKKRRHIDPTTCERDYSGEEVEFMKALEKYKRSNSRPFPTCSEILEVLRELGYVKTTQAEVQFETDVILEYQDEAA